MLLGEAPIYFEDPPPCVYHPRWFVERVASGDARLHFAPPVGERCAAPDKLVEVKARNHVLQQTQNPPGSCDGGDDSLALSLTGLQFKGGTFSLSCCHGCELSDLALEYPTFNRHVPEMNAPNKNCTPAAISNGGCGKGQAVSTRLIGNGNTVTNVSLTMTNNGGLKISGDHNHVENILIDNTDWLGTLTYVPLALSGNHNALLHSTVRRFGNAGVVSNIPNTAPKPLVPANATQKPPQPMAGRKTEAELVPTTCRDAIMFV